MSLPQLARTPNEEFQIQIARLRANYGGDKFPTEKCALIWEELRSFSAEEIRAICTDVIAHTIFPPVAANFMESAAIAREQRRARERKQESREAREAWTRMPDWIREKFLPKRSPE